LYNNVTGRSIVQNAISDDMISVHGRIHTGSVSITVTW
jgi:hypothetical protein